MNKPDPLWVNDNVEYQRLRRQDPIAGPLIREAKRRWQKENYEGLRIYRRHWFIVKRYNISVERYQELLKEQDYKCKICGKLHSEDKRGVLTVDHDHSCCPGATSCGKCVRGLICNECNRGLGFFKDSLDILKNAVEYIRGSYEQI